jgi:isoquinoline 1-oxidoreductase beta subunit
MEQGLKAPSASRRGFLAGSAALASGLAGALVVPLGAACAAGPAPLAITGFLAVLPDGAVSLALPKTEMGQGILTAITMIVAEELGVSPTAVHVAIPEADPARFAPIDTGTGGSTSIRELWKPLRQAGANARAALIGAAARTWKVAPAGLVLDDGAVVDPARGPPSGLWRIAGAGHGRAAADRCGAARPGGLEDHRQGHPRLDSAAKVRGKAPLASTCKCRG